MSDIPSADDGAEELDLGEIEEEGDVGEDGGQEPGEDGESPDSEADAEENESEDVAPPPRQGRKTEAQRWRERAERAEREAAEARGFRQAAEQFRPQQQVDPRIAEQQRQQRLERLSMMSPVEAAEFIAQEKEQQVQQMLLMQSLQFEDRIDKRDFDQQARTSRVHAQYRDEVERELASERQRGNLRATRDDILHRLVGRDAVSRAARAAPAQRRGAQRRVAGQQTRPTNARGDGAAEGGRGGRLGDPAYDEQLAREALRKGLF